MNLRGVDPRWLLYTAAIAGVAFVAWRLVKGAQQAGQAVSDALPAIGRAVNPTSDENLAYRGVNAVGGAVAGDRNWTLGGWLYDITHDPIDLNARPGSLTPPAAPADEPPPSPFNVGA